MEQPSQSYIEPVEESCDEIDFITHMHEGSFGLEDRSRVSEQANQENSFHYGRSENKNQFRPFSSIDHGPQTSASLAKNSGGSNIYRH